MRAALGMVAVLALAAPASAAAQAPEQWVEREFETEINFSGDNDGCEVEKVSRRVALPYPARNVRVEQPRKGQVIQQEGTRTPVARISEAHANQGADPYAWEVLVEVKGGACLLVGEDDWETKDIKVRVDFEQRVGPGTPTRPPGASPIPLTGPCVEAFATIARLRTLRVSCAYARSLVSRYRRTLRIRGAHRLTPYVCFDSGIASRRSVSCRDTTGQRRVWFHYGNPPVALAHTLGLWSATIGF